MKYILCLLIFFLFLEKPHAQIVRIDYLMETVPQLVAPISNTPLAQNQYPISMHYGSAQIKNLDIITKLKRKTITRIDLIYTAYKRSNKFEQHSLNRQRIQTLKRHFPIVFDNNLIQWNFIEQQTTDYQMAEDLFHGFMVYTTEPAEVSAPNSSTISESSNGRSKLSTEEEIVIIKKILEEAFGSSSGTFASESPLSGGGGTYEAPKTIIKIDTLISERVIKNTTRRFTGLYLPRNKRLLEKGKRFKRPGLFKLRKKESLDPDPALDKTVYDTTFTESEIYEEGSTTRSIISTLSKSGYSGGWSPARSSYRQHLQDTVVLRVLEKRKTRWENHIIVEDVTGSMYPYIAQTFIWRRNNFERLNAPPFVFFNDGDTGPNGYEHIGNIKGIYDIQDDSIEVVEEVCYSTMRKGSGRDAPENNLEAVIKALKKYPDNEGIVMIADNFAPVKDIKLLSKIDIPIQIILCGVERSGGRIHADYLKIAIKTKGAIYTMNDDFEALSELEGGNTIKIGDQKFKLTGDELLLVH